MSLRYILISSTYISDTDLTNINQPQYNYHILVIVVVPPVVTVDFTTPTTMPLSWTSPGPVVDSYAVAWTSRECPDVDEGNITITNGSTSYTISGLQEGSSYTVNVTATNTAGSAVSEPVTERTQETSEILFQTLLTEVKNLILSAPAPSAPPNSVSASGDNSSSITVQWGPVNCIDRNGDITGYSVRYAVQGNMTTQTVSVSGGETDEVMLSGLLSSTNYSIEVAAVNSAGTGVYSSPVVALRDSESY